MSQIDRDAILAQLHELESSESVSQEIVDSAREWREAILGIHGFLDRTDHPIVFIGRVGGGKSSLIGAASDSIIGDPPTDKTTLKSQSVLAIGGGRTTVCEVRIRSATDQDPGSLGLQIEPFDEDEMRREIALFAEDAVNYLTEEHLHDGKREIFRRDSLGGFRYDNELIEPSPLLGLRVLMDRGVHEPAVRAIAAFLQRISVYHDPDLWGLRMQGSNSSDDRVLHTRGTNALALLRRWQQERANRNRYQFVLDGLNAAFPNTVEDMDFQEAGNTLAARFYRPGGELSTPLANEANGVLQLLLLLCELAHAEDESLVAIDEPENGLHPYALRAFLRRAASWARQHKVSVLLATHSTVLLDALSETPEQVFVMKTAEPDAPVPTALDDLCDRAWLEQFQLGELYGQGEIGSNEDEM